MGALLASGSARFGALVALVLVFYFGYRHTIWLPREGQMPEAFSFFAVPDTVWHSVAWILFSAILVALFVSAVRPAPPASDLLVRRLVVLAAVTTYGTTALTRYASGRTFGLELAPAVVLAIAAAAIAATLVVLRWPPPTAWLLALLVGAGIVGRLVLIALIPPDPAFADNIPAVERSLERLAQGLTPYAVHEFATHTQTMPYLPFTFLAYLPAFAIGLDLRVTNLALSLALTVWCWAVVRALPLPAATRSGLVLMAALLFALPTRISQDLFTTWAPFNLLLAGAFGLMALARIRLAAAAYGASLAAMPVGAFVAPPLLVLALRTRPLREVALLAAIVVAVGAVPTLVFLLWDPAAFFRAFSYGTSALWGNVAAGTSTLPLLLWHDWLGAWLLAVQAALVLGVTALAWTRLRTVRGLIALSAVLYLWLVITGPHIAQYMTAVVLYLALLEEATLAAGVTAGDRELGLAPAPRAAYAGAQA